MADHALQPVAAEQIVAELRPHLFAIAYRMLGSVGDAEDVVQEAFLRYQREVARGATVDSPRAFLTTVVTRLAIDELRSARARRESYFGPWLPEPILTAGQPGAIERAERSDSLSLSFLVLLETLSPVERAVFLLREVFDYDYDEIAAIVEKTAVNCRQIFARARQRINERKPRFQATPEAQQELAERFFDAVENGRLPQLINFLAVDAAFYGDGGGKARGLPRPVHGSRNVGRLLASFLARYHALSGRLQRAQVNGQPGALFFDSAGRLVSVWALEIADGAIRTIRSIINPDKLDHLGYPLSALARGEASAAEAHEPRELRG